jgi:hypothetical protein
MVSIDKYQIDAAFLIFANTLTHLRKTKRLSLFNGLLSPIDSNQSVFLDKVVEINKNLSINFQTGLFEYILNGLLNAENSVKIENTNFRQLDIYKYNLEENDDDPLIAFLSEPISAEEEQYVFYLSEKATEYDFLVKIPFGILNLNSTLQADVDKISQIHAFIKKYKFAGKRYRLVNY